MIKEVKKESSVSVSKFNGEVPLFQVPVVEPLTTQNTEDMSHLMGSFFFGTTQNTGERHHTEHGWNTVPSHSLIQQLVNTRSVW